MSNNKEEIKKLIKACLKGDELAYNKLYKNYYTALMKIAIRYSRDADEANDYFQNIFLKIVKNLSKYNFNGSFEGWMKRIAVNESINYYKRTNKSNLTHYEYDNAEVLKNKDNISDNSIFSYLSEEELMKLVADLPASYKAVFNLYVIDEYSHKEISKILNISEGTSKSNLSRARKILREKLREIEEYETKNEKKYRRHI